MRLLSILSTAEVDRVAVRSLSLLISTYALLLPYLNFNIYIYFFSPWSDYVQRMEKKERACSHGIRCHRWTSPVNVELSL